MTARDGAERLLAVATTGLPRRWAEWGAAMRAELAAIDDASARASFARSAALAAFVRGLGLAVAAVLGSAVLVAVTSVVASRAQLPVAGPGLLGVTVPVPAATLLVVTLVVGALARSTRFSLTVGTASLVVTFLAVFAVLAIEGQLWMRDAGVFILDGDPPKGTAGPAEVVLNLFTTGMWVGHIAVWGSCTLIGAAVGSALSRLTGPASHPPRSRASSV